MKHTLTLIGALLLVPTFSFATLLSSMNKDEATAALSDKTITTISAATLNDKLIMDSFTGHFSKDGKMIGSFSTKPPGEPQNDTGVWSVDSNGMLCYKWDHWTQGKERCVTLYKLSNGLLIINKENAFESMIISEQIRSGNQMDKAHH